MLVRNCVDLRLCAWVTKDHSDDETGGNEGGSGNGGGGGKGDGGNKVSAFVVVLGVHH